ncbi:SWIM zinc finger family protein [Haloarcula sp. GH36]|uniref:SWIM zinc finger family protein n=1 Tax=Haloarcula montana TaxID=3111776 RepID=UPI002D7740BD|nr:SWIM zinc finger family protein [Haloarcula sp. GH36]
MRIDESGIRQRCTEAVFERGQNYQDEGRVSRLSRFGEHITADVRGSKPYDVAIDLSTEAFEATCTCPYTGPGVCKHVVAVLLETNEDPPADERDQINELLDDTSDDELRSFLRAELARTPDLRDRFRVRFGDADPSVGEYRAEVDELFDEHTTEYPVVTEAIDFSDVFEQGEQYRERDQYRAAATVYRAIAEGIEANEGVIDAAYDHYAQAFQRALDGWVECLQQAEITGEERRDIISELSERRSDAVGPYAERYEEAIRRLETS